MSDFGPIISAGELAGLLGENDVVVIDCRFDLMRPSAGREAWREGHIPSASYLDLDKDLSSEPGPTTGRHPLPEAANLRRTFGRAGVGPDSRVVVYDSSSGGIASRAWWLLKWLGHERVALLERGFSGWVEDDYPIETGETEVEVQTFPMHAAARAIVTTEEVAAGFDDRDRLRLVDAREAGRYRGEHEPIDHTAGRIPGARNLPFTDLLDAEGRFLKPDDLRQRFAAVLGDDRSRPWVAMCGSGVTACHLAVAADVAGYAEPALYVGSFSEWIQNTDRPVHTG